MFPRGKQAHNAIFLYFWTRQMQADDNAWQKPNKYVKAAHGVIRTLGLQNREIDDSNKDATFSSFLQLIRAGPLTSIYARSEKQIRGLIEKRCRDYLDPIVCARDQLKEALQNRTSGNDATVTIIKKGIGYASTVIDCVEYLQKQFISSFRQRDGSEDGDDFERRGEKRRRSEYGDFRFEKRRRRDDDDEDDFEEEGRRRGEKRRWDDEDEDNNHRRIRRQRRDEDSTDIINAILEDRSERSLRDKFLHAIRPNGFRTESATRFFQRQKKEMPLLLRTINFVMGILEKMKAARSKDGLVCLMKRTRTTPTYPTLFYKPKTTISDFISSIIMDERSYGEFWAFLAAKSNQKNNLVKYLTEIKSDDRFNDYYIDRCAFSFHNGVYLARDVYDNGQVVVPGNTFITHASGYINELLPSRYSVAKYIKGEVKHEWLTCENPMDIPTPVMDSVLCHQKLNYWIRFMYYALAVGRPVFPIGTYDQYQIAVMFYGPGNTSKSTIIKLLSKIYPSNRTYTMSNDTQGQFSPANATDANVIYITELRKNFSLPQSTFMSMTCGERVECSIKHVQKTIQVGHWEAAFIMAGNHLFDFVDDGGNVARRIIIFGCSYPISEADSTLDGRLKAELPAILIKGLRCYAMLTRMTGPGNLWTSIHKPDLMVGTGPLSWCRRDVESIDGDIQNELPHFFKTDGGGSLDLEPSDEKVDEACERFELSENQVRSWIYQQRCQKRSKILPSYFFRKRDEVQSETNAFTAFLDSPEHIVMPGEDENREDYYVPENILRDEFTNYCRQHKLDMRRHLSPVAWQAALKKHGCTFDPDPENPNPTARRKLTSRVYPRGGTTMMQKKWIVGLDIRAK